MASPKHFTGANLRLTAPDKSEITIEPMHVHVTESESISRWRLSPEEIEQVVKSGDVWVSLLVGANAQPPLRVSAFPFMEMRNEQGEIIGGYDPDNDVQHKPIRIVESDFESEN